MTNYTRGNGGHAHGHVRDAFLDAIEAYRGWRPGRPEPTAALRSPQAVTLRTDHELSLAAACGLVWNCTDILPGIDFGLLVDCGVEPKSRTYAAAARAFRSHNRQRRQEELPRFALLRCARSDVRNDVEFVNASP